MRDDHRRSGRPRGTDPTDDPSFWFHVPELPHRPQPHPVALFGAARFAGLKDLGPYLGPPDDNGRHTKLPLYAALIEGAGGRLEPVVHCDLHLDEALRTRHVLAVGNTGSGKTTRVVLPLIHDHVRDPGRVVVAIDAKGGKLAPVIRHLVARYRPGTPVQRLNFRDITGARFNVLQGVQTEGDAYAIAHRICTLVDRGSEKDGAFWVNNSIQLITGIILALVRLPGETVSLGRVRALLQGSLYDFAVFLDKHPAVPPILERLMELRSDANQTGACVFQDALMRLSTFMDEAVAATTAPGPGQLDLDAIVLGRGVLVLEVDEMDVELLKPVTNIFLTQLFDRLIALAARSPGKRLPHPVSLFIDEFASAVGRIEQIEVRLNTLRERGVGIVAAVQSITQLLGVYGTAAPGVLSGFATKVFMPGLDHSDAEYASRLSGVMTVTNAPSVVEDPHALAQGDWSPPPAPSGFGAPRALLLPEEVSRPPAHPVFGRPATLFLADGTPPCYIYPWPAYELPVLSQALEDVVGGETGVDAHTARLQSELAWERAGGPAQAWWGAFEGRGSAAEFVEFLERLAALAPLWRGLRGRGASFLDEGMLACRHSGTKDPEANLCFLRFHLLKRREEERLQGKGPSSPE